MWKVKKKRIFFSTHYLLFLDTADDGVTVFQNMILLQKELEKYQHKEILLSLSQQIVM